MKKLIITTTVALFSASILWAQEPTTQEHTTQEHTQQEPTQQEPAPQDTIATFKVDNGNDVILRSRDNGLSINIAGYKISLSPDIDKNSSNSEFLSAWSELGEMLETKKNSEKEKYDQRKENRAKFTFSDDIQFGLISLTTPDYSMYSSDNQDFLNLKPGKSIFFGINVFGLNIPLNKKGSVAIKTGVDLMYYNFAFSNDVTLSYEDGVITPQDIDCSIKKSKLTTAYAAMPLSLNVKCSENISFEAGAYAGLLINSYTKYKKPIVKSYLQGTNDIITGASLAIYHKDVGLYCNYNFSPLFDTNCAPETCALSFGIIFK